MTKENKQPYLFLKRLVVITKQGKAAYDQPFHDGVNIIRGVNSSGKSTLSNFIFYALGGDFNNWTREAFECESVFAEVEINEGVYTLKRNITENIGQPMSIFWGNYENSKGHEGWQTYPYRQTDGKINFSTVLFNLLQFPEVRSDEDNRLTMHQVLRLLYIDQDSPVQNLFRFERFDWPTTRQAISELLLGIYDDSLYNDRIQLRNTQKELQEKKRDLQSVSRALQSAGSTLNIDKLLKEKNTFQEELANIDEQISIIQEKNLVQKRKGEPLKIQNLGNELRGVKTTINNLNSKLSDLQANISDSQLFIEVLQKRLKAIDESSIARDSLGDIPLHVCPKCLTPLKHVDDPSVCVLCHEPLNDQETSQIKRMRQEIALQIDESLRLLESKKNREKELSVLLFENTERANIIQSQIDVEEKEVRSTRDEKIDTLLVRKGTLLARLEYINNQIAIIEQLNILSGLVSELVRKVSELTRNITIKVQEQESKKAEAMNAIYSITKTLLQRDLKRQEEFENPRQVEIDFSDDIFSLNGNFNFSASSNIYLKNSVRFAIFFASLIKDFFRYPRFILCDNMEDKGMEAVRTQNFQKVIVSTSESIKTRHQIIFTTSMVDPELTLRSDLCIGPPYTRENKSLTI